MKSKPEELRDRAKRFALQVLGLYRALPKVEEKRVVGVQLLRSALSTAANYRAVCRARSKAEFIAKIGIVVEEADESEYWLVFAGQAGLGDQRTREELIREARELLAIFAASQKTAKFGRQ